LAVRLADVINVIVWVSIAYGVKICPLSLSLLTQFGATALPATKDYCGVWILSGLMTSRTRIRNLSR